MTTDEANNAIVISGPKELERSIAESLMLSPEIDRWLEANTLAGRQVPVWLNVQLWQNDSSAWLLALVRN